VRVTGFAASISGVTSRCVVGVYGVASWCVEVVSRVTSRCVVGVYGVASWCGRDGATLGFVIS